MSDERAEKGTVLVHRAGSSTEAVVIRGLLESAGIVSHDYTGTDPFPMREPPKGFRDTDIVVLESQAEEARGVIASYLSSSDTIQIEESDAQADNEDHSKG